MRRLMPSTMRSSWENRTGPAIAASRIETLHLPPTWSSTWRTVHASASRLAEHASGSVTWTGTPVFRCDTKVPPYARESLSHIMVPVSKRVSVTNRFLIGLYEGGIRMGRPRALALTVLCAAMMMIILDGTIVTVALPAIQRDLGFSSSGLAWVVNAYLIAFGGLLLLAGRLGDLIGGKRVFLAGLIVFTAASLLCGFSVSQPMLIAARFAQGAGGAMASAVSLGMIVRLFPEPPERAKALGAYSFTGAGGAVLVTAGLMTGVY